MFCIVIKLSTAGSFNLNFNLSCILWIMRKIFLRSQNYHHQSNLIQVYPRKQVWPDLPHSNSNLSNSHSPFRSIHGILLLQTNTLLSFSTCVFHVFFGRPRFLLSFTSNSNAFLKTCPSSLLNTCPYHLTPFAITHLL